MNAIQDISLVSHEPIPKPLSAESITAVDTVMATIDMLGVVPKSHHVLARTHVRDLIQRLMEIIEIAQEGKQ